MPGMADLVFSSPVFWLCLLLVPVLTLLGDVAFRAAKTTVFTTETDRIRIAEIVKREVAPYINSGGRQMTESSCLLRNVRKRFQRNPKVRWIYQRSGLIKPLTKFALLFPDQMLNNVE